MSKTIMKAGAAAAIWIVADAALAQPMGLASLNSPLASPLGSSLASPMGPQAAMSGQRPGLLSGVVGCQASGYKQGVGAVGGAAAGGLVGAKLLKSNKLAGTLGGAAVGGAAGSWVGCRMQQGDQARRVAAARAREDAAADADRDDASDRRGAASAAERRGQPGSSAGGLDGLRFAPRVTPASDYDTAPAGRYVAATITNLRSAPSTGAEVLARIDPEQQMQVLAAVAGASWVLVGVEGRADGYAYSPNLRAVGRSDQAQGCRPVRQTSSVRAGEPAVSETLEACPQAGGGWALRRRAG